MGKSLVVGAAALLSSLFLTSCGPEKSARDRELDQLDETVQKNKANNDEVAGWYVGKIKYMTGNVKEQNLCLYLFSTLAFQDLPARGETVETALLGGYIFINNNPVAYNFSKSKYNTDDSTIRLTGETGSTIRGVTLLEVVRNGDHLVGNFFAPNLFSDVDVNRTNKENCLKGVR